MDEPIVAGVFGLLGVLVGALLQFWFNRRANQESRYLELKSEACADYVNSIAAVAFASPPDRNKALEKVAAAKGRVCVFGDKDVIDAAVVLEGTSLNLGNQDAQAAFIGLLQAMRRRGIASGDVADHGFRVLLLGDKPSNPAGEPGGSAAG